MGDRDRVGVDVDDPRVRRPRPGRPRARCRRSGCRSRCRGTAGCPASTRNRTARRRKARLACAALRHVGQASRTLAGQLPVDREVVRTAQVVVVHPGRVGSVEIELSRCPRRSLHADASAALRSPIPESMPLSALRLLHQSRVWTHGVSQPVQICDRTVRPRRTGSSAGPRAARRPGRPGRRRRARPDRRSRPRRRCGRGGPRPAGPRPR